MSSDPIKTRTARWVKRSVNYRIINGMKAVGNQCPNCNNVNIQINHCSLMNFLVSAKGHCDKFDRRKS